MFSYIVDTIDGQATRSRTTQPETEQEVREERQGSSTAPSDQQIHHSVTPLLWGRATSHEATSSLTIAMGHLTIRVHRTWKRGCVLSHRFGNLEAQAALA